MGSGESTGLHVEFEIDQGSVRGISVFASIFSLPSVFCSIRLKLIIAGCFFTDPVGRDPLHYFAKSQHYSAFIN
jgi:hypothetical protein